MTGAVGWLLLIGAVAPVAVVALLLCWASDISLHRYRSDGRPGPAPTSPEPEPARSAWVTPPVVAVAVALVVLTCLGAR